MPHRMGTKGAPQVKKRRHTPSRSPESSAKLAACWPKADRSPGHLRAPGLPLPESKPLNSSKKAADARRGDRAASLAGHLRKEETPPPLLACPRDRQEMRLRRQPQAHPEDLARRRAEGHPQSQEEKSARAFNNRAEVPGGRIPRPRLVDRLPRRPEQ